MVLEITTLADLGDGGSRGGENSDDGGHRAELQKGQLFCTISYNLVLQVPQRFQLSLARRGSGVQPTDQILRTAGMIGWDGRRHRCSFNSGEASGAWARMNRRTVVAELGAGGAGDIKTPRILVLNDYGLL
ncbi:mannose-P-dolichol utilization defect 1 protein homolog [Striga asiatica]|uniref:Mannose-P-dolichol utilization defect 1 protein homolog n=1 Tax=Striga asiatica TaxID=4170 RepID=A0A5A7QLR6_STRAF|nr:mannose-P-dolichol utilization defect 1 protein homolog [Striga asiatica]